MTSGSMYPSGNSLYGVKTVLKKHKAAVTSARFSPDGKYIASSSDDCTVIIWNSETFEPCKTLIGHVQGISDLVWSYRDPHLLATASDDKTARIWSVRTGRALRILKGHTHHVTCIDFNYKGNLVATGSADENIRVWDIKQGKSMHVLAAHSEPISAVNFSRDGTVLVSSSYDGLIRLWDIASGHCLRTLVCDSANTPIMNVEFSPNGKYVLSSLLDGSIKLWNYMQNKCAKTYKEPVLKSFKYSSSCAFITQKGPFIAHAISNDNIGIWEVQTKVMVDMLKGHHGPVLSVYVHPKTDDYLVSASVDGTIIIWEAKAKAEA